MIARKYIEGWEKFPLKSVFVSVSHTPLGPYLLVAVPSSSAPWCSASFTCAMCSLLPWHFYLLCCAWGVSCSLCRWLHGRQVCTLHSLHYKTEELAYSSPGVWNVQLTGSMACPKASCRERETQSLTGVVVTCLVMCRSWRCLRGMYFFPQKIIKKFGSVSIVACQSSLYSFQSPDSSDTCLSAHLFPQGMGTEWISSTKWRGVFFFVFFFLSDQGWDMKLIWLQQLYGLWVK